MRFRSLTGLGAAAVIVLVVGACSDAAPVATGPTDPSSAAMGASHSPGASLAVGGWRRLPDAPLAPRRNAYAFPFGAMVVVAGGTDSKPCPPNALCDGADHPLTDGAAYDAVTGSWSSISKAPVALGLGTSAVSGGMAFAWLWGDPPMPDWSTASFVSYDVITDRWQVLRLPPRIPGSSFDLASVPGGVVAYAPTDEAGGPDYWYDTERADWRELPDDPLGPSFGRSMIWSGDELILLAPELVPQPNSEEPALLRVAAFDPGSWIWRRLADSDILAGDPDWYGAQGEVINPSMERSDGGATNGWGRSIPGGGRLDPTTDIWTLLPPTPGQCDCYQQLAAGGMRYLLNRQGWVLDVASSSWLPLPRPDAAPDEGQATAWVDAGLFVFGGNAYGSTSRAEDARGAGRLFGEAWLWSAHEP